MHCDYTEERINIIETLKEIHLRLGRIKQINVPEPPISLTRHLVSIIYIIYIIL